MREKPEAAGGHASHLRGSQAGTGGAGASVGGTDSHDGLFVDAGIKGTRFIPSSDVSVLGDVAVLVRSEGRRGARAQCGYPRRALTPDGKHLGAICGAGVNEEA